MTLGKQRGILCRHEQDKWKNKVRTTAPSPMQLPRNRGILRQM